MADDDLTDSDLAMLNAAVAARQAADDQEVAEWAHKAEKLAAYWARLMDAGMPKNLAGVLTITAQNHANAMEDEAEE
jgi:hypothetical protein